MLADNEGLLTFDDDSPLFTKKKRKTKRKAKKKVLAKVENDIAPVEVPKRKQKKIVKVVNKHRPKYTIKSPSDCKHLLPAFKKQLNVVWARLNGDNIVAADVANYIRGVANVAKKTRPKEYEELRILLQYAKQL